MVVRRAQSSSDAIRRSLCPCGDDLVNRAIPMILQLRQGQGSILNVNTGT
jgi:hypothetical protein